eukprot:352004_1
MHPILVYTACNKESTTSTYSSHALLQLLLVNWLVGNCCKEDGPTSSRNNSIDSSQSKESSPVAIQGTFHYDSPPRHPTDRTFLGRRPFATDKTRFNYLSHYPLTYQRLHFLTILNANTIDVS